MKSLFGRGGYRGYSTRVRLVRFNTARAPVPIAGASDVYDLLKSARTYDRESLYSMMLDSINQLIGCEEVSRGNLNTARTLPREIYKSALLTNAAGIVLAHNHPSGSLEPSAEDISFTDSLAGAGRVLGVELYDHVIFNDRGYTSLRERGLGGL